MLREDYAYVKSYLEVFQTKFCPSFSARLRLLFTSSHLMKLLSEQR